jgi:protocatechuate 3,4-dioxygenase beta subunit
MFEGQAACTITPTLTEGPYYIDVDKIRSDIREDRQGTPLRLGARVLHADGCTPVKDAVFEVWHCDATGLYSGFEAASQGGRAATTDAKRYLRGAQVTNADGIAELLTIYPGWYRGRTVHIHAKVFIGNTEVLTGQLFFDEATTTEVFKQPPYSSHTGRDTRNQDDNIFSAKTVVTTTKQQDGSYRSLITIGVRA